MLVSLLLTGFQCGKSNSMSCTGLSINEESKAKKKPLNPEIKVFI